ncbi:MAG TPA: glycosyltransferase [Paludibacteraceae bacterium]|nr:glycosyltransferase [Paludibacteraceae bacterium]
MNNNQVVHNPESSNKKKALIITYYWIPSGGAGVQRWVKFVKYLRTYGIEPVVYTPENPEYPSEDLSLRKDIPADIEVLKTPIWEPYNVYRNLFGKKGEKINAGFISEGKKTGWKEKFSIWIRGNFLIPDPRKFWIKPSVRFLKEYLQKNQIDTIISTGPPHSMHMIGLGLKKQLPELTWIADFRDPWTNIDFYKELNLTYLADRRHKNLEKRVVKNADCVIVVGGEMVREYTSLKPKRIELITNGYDEADISDVKVEMDRLFTISHIGTLNAARNPITLWKVLSEMCREDEDFRTNLQIQLVGKVDFSVLEDIRKYNLENNLLKIDYMAHSDAIARQQASRLLLLLVNNTANAKGILTGKFFEYLAAKRPILAIGPVDGEVAQVLKETSAGCIADFEDEVQTRKIVTEYYEQYKRGELTVSPKSIEKYSRRELTGELVRIIEDIDK